MPDLTARAKIRAGLVETFIETGCSDKTSQDAADGTIAEISAMVLTEAADRAQQLNPDRDADFSAGVDWTVGELRAAAIEVTL